MTDYAKQLDEIEALHEVLEANGDIDHYGGCGLLDVARDLLKERDELQKKPREVWVKAGPRAMGWPAKESIEGIYSSDPHDGFVMRIPVQEVP